RIHRLVSHLLCLPVLRLCFRCSRCRFLRDRRFCWLAWTSKRFRFFLVATPHMVPPRVPKAYTNTTKRCFRLRDSEFSLCPTPAQHKILRKVSRQAPAQMASLPSFITALVG